MPREDTILERAEPLLAFGARVIGIELAKMIIDEWLSAEFEGGRHQTRVDMITAIENK